MEIILLKDVDNVGDKHTIVKVKDGFGRNYLIPQGLALVANSTNRRKLNEIIRLDDLVESKRLDVYQEMANTLSGATLRIGAKAGTSGKIFGSVNNSQLAAAIKDQFGVEIERRKIEIPEEVKTLGTYTANINLHKEVKATVTFEVVEDQ
ncbi:MAG: 50S ribosomal protein L9 [Saprospiraceae bacterium]|nr:50S ribosomal protein L9 [Saprospiraceae bacterium]